MTNTEKKLIDKGYQLKKTYNNKADAKVKQQQYQAKGFNAQVIKDTPNNSWKLYVKRR